jgi:hypothetical protein
MRHPAKRALIALVCILTAGSSAATACTLPDRSETKGARERLSRHLMKMYIEGETDEHRSTVAGLSYLRNLDQEIDSRH